MVKPIINKHNSDVLKHIYLSILLQGLMQFHIFYFHNTFVLIFYLLNTFQYFFPTQLYEMVTLQWYILSKCLDHLGRTEQLRTEILQTRKPTLKKNLSIKCLPMGLRRQNDWLSWDSRLKDTYTLLKRTIYMYDLHM